MCTATRQRLSRLDWMGQLQFVSFRDLEAKALPGIAPERLAARLHVRYDRTGRVAEGIWALAAIAARLPLLWPLWPLVVAAGLIGLGQSAYDFIARRRRIVPVGQCDEVGCDILGRG